MVVAVRDRVGSGYRYRLRGDALMPRPSETKAALRDGPKTSAEIAKLTNTDVMLAYARISTLKRRGQVYRVNPGSRGVPAIYALTEEGKA
jgi:hypothetical protein